MTVPFTRWPDEFARRYREKGYWQDLPLTRILTRHANNDAVAIIDGERRYTYRQFNEAVDNLASALQAQGLKRGDTALVQLGTWLSFTSPSLHCYRQVLRPLTRSSAISAAS
jgi:2,3-dihydroxybenzoate-AMP ligase